MAFPNEANILRRTLTAFGSLVASLRNRQWGLLRNPAGNYSADGYNRNSGSMVAKDEFGLIHEFWERQQVQSYVGNALQEIAADLSTLSSSGLQVDWTSTGIEWAHYDSATGNFLSWTATPSGNYDFSGYVEYAVDSFGNLLLRGSFLPPVAVAALSNTAGLRILRITNSIIDSGIAGALGAGKYAPQFVTAIAAAGGTEPLWLWKGWFEFQASNQLFFSLKDDTNGGVYSRPAAGQSVHFTRVAVPKVAPVAQGVSAAASGISTQDGDSIAFTGDGTNPNPLSAEVIIDPAAGNSLSSSAAGLYAAGFDPGNIRFIKDLAELTAFFAEPHGVNGVLVGFVSGEIVLNHGVNTFDFWGRKQLYFGAIVGHSDSDLMFYNIGGYGSLYIYSPFAFGAGGSISCNGGGMSELWLKRASQIGGAVTFTATGWSGGAYYETTQNALVTMGSGWTQQYWDDTSGDSRAAADSSDSVPGFLVDKICDQDENAFSVAVVGGARKLKIEAGFGKRMFVVSSLSELIAALQDTTYTEKHIFRSPVSTAFQIGGSITNVYGANIFHSQGSNSWVIGSAAFASAAGAFLMFDPDVSILGTNTANQVYLRAPVLSVYAATSLSLTACTWIVESLGGAGAAGIASSINFDRLKNSLLPSGVSASGFVAYRYGAGGAVAPRSIAAAAGSGLSVSNADGVNGNPTIDLNLTADKVFGATAPIVSDPTGFTLMRDGSDIAFDNGTRVFTISPKSPATTFEYWVNGVRYTKTGAQTITIPNSEGLHFIYYSGATLTTQQTAPANLLRDYAFVALIYWDATNLQAILINDERHGISMDYRTHEYLHNSRGSAWGGGFGLDNISPDAADTAFGIAAGVIWDEDLKFDVSAIANPATIPVLYRSGSSAWRKESNSGTFVLQNSGADTLPMYNLNSAGSWSKTAVTNGNFVLYHIFGTDDIISPVVSVMGQEQYSTKALARAAALSEVQNIQFGTLPSLEFKALFTIIVRGSTSLAADFEIASVNDDNTGSYIDWRAGFGSGAAGSSSAGSGTEEWELNRKIATAPASPYSVGLAGTGMSDGSNGGYVRSPRCIGSFTSLRAIIQGHADNYNATKNVTAQVQESSSPNSGFSNIGSSATLAVYRDGGTIADITITGLSTAGKYYRVQITDTNGVATGDTINAQLRFY